MGRGRGCCVCDVWVGVGGWFGFVRGSANPGLWVVQGLGKGGCGRVWFGFWWVVGFLGSWCGYYEVLGHVDGEGI